MPAPIQTMVTSARRAIGELSRRSQVAARVGSAPGAYARALVVVQPGSCSSEIM
jgi:hypothetical protein